MTHRDGSEREMAKWAHYALVSARQLAEDAQRQALAELDDDPACGGLQNVNS
jgi:hypothetical protein